MNNRAKYKDLILETIDQLRKRKARPDLERICHMLERRHGLNASDVERELENLVEDEIVIKVDYKGSTSYRNAAKWVKTKSYLTGQVLNSLEVSKVLVKAVWTCAADAGGASLKDVEQYLVTQPANLQAKLAKVTLETALDREILAGNIKKLASGKYVLTAYKAAAMNNTNPPANNPSTKSAAHATNHNNNNTSSSSPQHPSNKGSSSSATKSGATARHHAPRAPPVKIAPKVPTGQQHHQKAIKSAATALSGTKHALIKRGRPASKRKKFKKTHGPDFVEYSDLSSDVYRDSDEMRCDYCQMTAVTNQKGEAEELLVCKDCNAKAHPSCMDYSPELAARSRMSPWQCIDCKTCALCDDSGDGDSMLFCDACDKGYHMECHKPKITEKPLGKWVCSACVNEVKGLCIGVREHADSSTEKMMEKSQFTKQSRAAAEVDTTGLPTPCDSPAPEDEATNRECAANSTCLSTSFEESSIRNYPQAVPDATCWTIDDVERFFRCVGFPEQAPSFREQEIDGKSLLLMKRSDVLTGLSIKLGPAVKIYNHVKRLQTGLPDGHLLY